MRLIPLIAFTLSFCGISYQFLLVRTIDPFLQNEVLSQAITLGFYLLSMGAGAALFSRGVKKRPLHKLFWIESLMAAVGSLLVPLCFALITGMELFSDGPVAEWLGADVVYLKLLLFQPITIVIGTLTGAEIPLLSAWLENKGRKNATTHVLAFSYFGALAGSFLVPLAVIPRFGLYQGGLLLGLATLAAITMIVFLIGNARALLRAGAVIAAIVLLQSSLLARRADLEQIMLKTFYVELRLPAVSLTSLKAWWRALDGIEPITRLYSPYQNIDIVPSRLFSSSPQTRDSFELHLNHQPQFTTDTLRAYHESMVAGALNLSRVNVRKALVLGGGDGLVAAELLRRGVESITLVELDPVMIELASAHPKMHYLNHGALKDPRVRVVVGDAFRFVRTTEETFDAAFVDFPFPTNYDLLKLFSVEFYRALAARIRDDGFFVFDAPILIDPRIRQFAPKPYPHEVFHHTLRAAGLKRPFAYGPMEPFVYVNKDGTAAAFRYELLGRDLSGKTLFNLAPLEWAFPESRFDPKLVNSVFRPKVLRW